MMKEHFLIVLFLSANAIQSSNISILPAEHKDKNLYKAVSVIVQENFIDPKRNLLFYASFDTNSTKNLRRAKYIFNGVLSEILNYPYFIIYNNVKLFRGVKHNEVVFLDSIETFRHFYHKIKYSGNMDLSDTVLYIASLKTIDEETMYTIFQELYKMEILNVALIVMLENGEILMFTYFPFNREACRDFKPVIINRYLADHHRWQENDFFPFKLRDLFGCPLYCCTWEQVPYFKVDRSNGNISEKDLVGLDAEALKFAAATINATIEIRWIEPVNENIEEKASFFAELILKQCDLSVGGFNYKNDFDETTFAQTRYFLFSHIYIVTNVMKFYTIYDKLAFPFHYNVWVALGLTFALSFLLISISGWQRNWTEYRNFLIGSANKAPHLHLYALAMGNNMSTTNLPKRNFARFLLTCWLLLTFILRTAYQSGMYQMLRNQKQWNPPLTIENVIEQNYLISTTPKYQKYIDILPPTARVHIFNTTIMEAFQEILNANEPIALIAPYEYYGYLGKMDKSLWEDLHLVPQRLLSRQLTIYSPHHSFIVPVLNKKLSYAHFHGFVKLWNRLSVLPIEIALKYEYQNENTRNKNKNSQTILLTMNELGAIFMISVWLYVSAVAVFALELIWHRCGNKLKDWLSNGQIF